MTLWYDYTTTLRAISRNGIANVEWSIGDALRQADHDVRYFSLADRHGLSEIDPNSQLSGAYYALDAVAPRFATTFDPTWRDDVRAILRGRLGRSADPVIHGISAVYQAPRRMARRLSASGWRGPRRTTTRLPNVVCSGDVVVSMGADWEGALARSLGSLRERAGCRVVTMVYDLIPLTHTHLAFHNEPTLFTSYYRDLIAASDLITCISEQTRQDLLAFGAANALAVPRTEVLRLGESCPESTNAVDRGDFFLWVGTIERRKNLELLYDALRILESEGEELPQVVVAGGIGWGTDDLITELSLQSTAASRAIVLLGEVDDATLESLYRRARALLYPSHYEGWGLPVREAAVRGCPVAAGDSPAVREAAAGYAGATMLPVNDPAPWADYMRAVPPSVEPVPAHTWGDVAGQLLALVDTLA